MNHYSEQNDRKEVCNSTLGSHEQKWYKAEILKYKKLFAMSNRNECLKNSK